MSLTEDITKFVAEANLLFETESEQFPRLFEFIWTGVAAIFLFFMQIGYIMLASGGSQRSNMQNTVYHILIAYGLTTFWWWVLGYGFAHGDSRGGNAFIGTKEFVLADGFFLFHKFIVHLGYCLVAVVVAVAGLFERSTTLAYVALASVMSFLVVPVVMHWLWSTNGWLSTRNPANAIVYVLDFGGSGVAHTVGGMAALVASIVVGPRRNAAKALRHKQATLDGAVSPSTPRDVPSVPKYTAAVLFGDSTLHFVGGLALWLGSYGLCQARVGTQEQSRALAGLIGVNTSLAASFAGITAAIYAHFRAPERKTRYVVNGFISGLGAIAAGAPFIQPYGAMAIGVLSAVVFILATALLDRLNIDDTMDSISAHLFPGAFGLIAAAVASDVNLLAQFFPTLTQSKGVYVGSALLTIVCIVVWVGVIVGGILLLLQAAGWLQLSDVEQERGLDPIADPLRERVRINTHLLETSNVQGLTTSERACTNCGMWMTGDCVRGCTNDYYHRACFQCAVCSKPLLKSFVNVLNEPLCVACASSGRVGPAALSPGVKSSQKPRAAADAVVNASPRDDDNVEADDADADGEYTYSYQYEEISGDEGQDNAEQQGTEMKPVETEPAANVSETESYETDSDEEVEQVEEEEEEEEEETETETEESTDSDETK